jgi:hypothetical protein
MHVTDLVVHNCIYKMNTYVERNIEGLVMLQYMVCCDRELSLHSPCNQLPTNLKVRVNMMQQVCGV